MVEIVKQHYYLTAHEQQHHFDNSESSSGGLLSWDDSKLKAFLLEKGIISPSSEREELILLAKSYADANPAHSYTASPTNTHSGEEGGVYSHATESISSGVSVASSAASSVASQASETLSSAYYATTEAPSLLYDFVAEKFNGSSIFLFFFFFFSPYLKQFIDVFFFYLYFQMEPITFILHGLILSYTII